jgi:two-component system chemotaxis response regulator CheY
MFRIFPPAGPNEITDSSDEYLVRSDMESDILVVDDSAAIRKILQRVLRQTGMAIRAIHEAGDGQEALALLAEHRVDLVLTDINMPKMDGLQLLASLKASAQWHSTPVVMITTEGGETKVAEAVKLGAAGYVRKPFTADQIKEKLVGILEPALPL